MTQTLHPSSPSASPGPAEPAASVRGGRQIGPYGTGARIVGGIGLLVGAFLIGVRPLDVLIGLVVANAVVLAALAVRGRSAPPLRWTGPIGHAATLAVGILTLSLDPVQVPAMLFYGSASLLAAARGMAACEIFAVSNWLRRRDDRLGCPVYVCADALDTELTGRTSVC
jgi:hypothetical protein